jgi:hypothetical protein
MNERKLPEQGKKSPKFGQLGVWTFSLGPNSPIRNELELYGMDTDIRCVLMCRIQIRMNGLDRFGRLAARLGAGGARPDFQLSA